MPPSQNHRSRDPTDTRARLLELLRRLPYEVERQIRSNMIEHVLARLDAAERAGQRSEAHRWEVCLVDEERELIAQIVAAVRSKAEGRRANLRLLLQVTAPTAFTLMVNVLMRHG